jgi:peptide/nickel transport system substrate-binding protein
MENRFGVKDFVIVVLLVAVIVMVGLCMMQYDRQWDVINQANNQLREQAHDLAEIRRTLNRIGDRGVDGGGVASSGKTQPAHEDLTSGFERVLKTHSAADYAPGDTIVGTFLAPPMTLTPIIANDAGAADIFGNVMESLADRDPNTLEFKPRLAKPGWKISDDQLTIDFELRHGITFSNGDPLTADDVVYTFDLIMNPDIEAVHLRTYLDSFKSVEKTGEYSVRFKFNRPYFKSFEIVAGMYILSKKFYSQFDAKTFNQSTGLLMGTGPYCLADPKGWKPEPGKPVELVRNQRYWGVAPAADKLVWKVIPSALVRQTAFINGETDVFNPTPEQYDQLLTNAGVISRTRHFDLSVPNSGYMYIGWNQKIDGKPTHFADPRVRRAMTMLLDRQRICKDIMRGYATVNTGPFSAMTPQSDPDIKPWPYDPEAAIKLLAEAGYHKENDTLIGPDGKVFSFKLTFNSSNSLRAQIAAYAKDALARAGIIVEVDPAEWSMLLQRAKDHTLEAFILGWTGGIEEDPTQIFSTAAIANSGSNVISYSNPELDRAMDVARTIRDTAPRMKQWHKVHRILHEDQPYSFLFITRQLTFVDGRIKGLEPTLTGLNSLQEWYVPSMTQKYTQ